MIAVTQIVTNGVMMRRVELHVQTLQHVRAVVINALKIVLALQQVPMKHHVFHRVGGHVQLPQSVRTKKFGAFHHGVLIVPTAIKPVLLHQVVAVVATTAVAVVVVATIVVAVVAAVVVTIAVVLAAVVATIAVVVLAAVAVAVVSRNVAQMRQFHHVVSVHNRNKDADVAA